MSGNIKPLDGETLDVVLRCAIQTTRLKPAARVEVKAIIGRFDTFDFQRSDRKQPKTTASTINNNKPSDCSLRLILIYPYIRNGFSKTM
jgi:hypothetical protein